MNLEIEMKPDLFNIYCKLLSKCFEVCAFYLKTIFWRSSYNLCKSSKILAKSNKKLSQLKSEVSEQTHFYCMISEFQVLSLNNSLTVAHQIEAELKDTILTFCGTYESM